MILKDIIKLISFVALSFSGCALICGTYSEPRAYQWSVRAPTNVGDIVVYHQINKSWHYEFLSFGHLGSLDLISPKYSYTFSFVHNDQRIEWYNDPTKGYPFILNNFDHEWYVAFYSNHKAYFYVYRKTEWIEIEKIRFPKEIAMPNINVWLNNINNYHMPRLLDLLYPDGVKENQPAIYFDVYSNVLKRWEDDPQPINLQYVFLFKFWDYLESSNATFDWKKSIPIEESIKFKKKYVK
ncbi:MAG: hypothetical protein O9264_11280 [Leptospira sp.]|nr:hypothetical protein [Leptospira sp.]